MAFLGFLIALSLFCHYKRRLRHYRRRIDAEGDVPFGSASAASWHAEWHRQWAGKFHDEARRMREMRRSWEREVRRRTRDARRQARRSGFPFVPPAEPNGSQANAAPAGRAQTDDRSGFATDAESHEAQVLRRARRRAAAEAGFYTHLMSYLGVIAFLALINFFTTWYPWFIWPALGWGIGLFSHWMAVFGSRQIKERFFDPAVEREVRREKVVMQTEKQASIDELSSTIAHEIRNPIAAAKSLVGQMGEDPTSVENVEYAKVALDELDRVERSISHLLKYAKEEDYHLDRVNIATVVDSALQEMRAKLDAGKVSVARNYIGGPTVIVDGEKMRQVFANILDNAIDALGGVAEGRRIDLFVENGGSRAAVRVRDNGCGIPPEKMERIFNPFFTTKDKGTGLGMAISKKIVEAHQGTIDAVSEVGRGTEFVVTLPLPQ
jgi:signal transduction histidine kinase